MTDPKNDDSLNLDSLSFEELGRVPACGNRPEETAEDSALPVQPPCRSRRGDSRGRELLGNHFPAEAESGQHPEDVRRHEN